MQSQMVSAMSRLPFESKTIPRGDESCAAVAGPPSLAGPDLVPPPAKVETRPSGVIR